MKVRLRLVNCPSAPAKSGPATAAITPPPNRLIPTVTFASGALRQISTGNFGSAQVQPIGTQFPHFATDPSEETVVMGSHDHRG